MTLHDISFQQRKKMLLTVPEFYSYYTPNLPVQVFKPVKNFSTHLSAIHKLLKYKNECLTHQEDRVMQFPVCHTEE